MQLSPLRQDMPVSLLGLRAVHEPPTLRLKKKTDAELGRTQDEMVGVDDTNTKRHVHVLPFSLLTMLG
jgi:hypothetical protein